MPTGLVQFSIPLTLFQNSVQHTFHPFGNPQQNEEQSIHVGHMLLPQPQLHQGFFDWNLRQLVHGDCDTVVTSVEC